MRSVLVVEDNTIAREGLALVLRQEGFRVEAVDDGRPGLDFLKNNPPPDVILLDLLMPELDGWQFLREFHAMQLQPRPRVIITTGSTVIGRDWALDHGCSGLLQKPFQPEEVFEEIRRCGLSA